MGINRMSRVVGLILIVYVVVLFGGCAFDPYKMGNDKLLSVKSATLFCEGAKECDLYATSVDACIEMTTLAWTDPDSPNAYVVTPDDCVDALMGDDNYDCDCFEVQGGAREAALVINLCISECTQM